MSIVDRVTALATPLLADLGLELYDVEHGGGTLKITVDRVGGVDLDTISVATRLLSRELDNADPIPGRYTLEVTSPGLERPLRTPAHFRRAVGHAVAVRTLADVAGERRVHGTLLSADDEGVTVGMVEGSDGGERHLRYTDIERARTVFEWTTTPKRTPSKATGRSGAKGGPKHQEASA